VNEEAKRKNTTEARVRAKVEHPLRILTSSNVTTNMKTTLPWVNDVSA